MHTIDVTKGESRSEVSRQWASRPDDQKFLSLSALREQVLAWRDASEAVNVASENLRVSPSEDGDLVVTSPFGNMKMNHFAFQRVASAAKAPADYLRGLPAELAAVNLNYGLIANGQERSLYVMRQPNESLLRGITSPRYGRIFDSDVADAVIKIAGDGTGDTDWKVPGTIDWHGAHGVTYNPKVDITKDTTTLYASDRDIFLFLVDDTHPIEVGKLANGDPDLMFRGFYVWNSEVGDKTFGLATMYLRGVCQNRNLWGVEEFQQVTIRHTAEAPARFIDEAAPALTKFMTAKTAPVIEAVKASKSLVVAKTDEERAAFLMKFGFSASTAKSLIQTSIDEEGRPPESVFDFSQAVTASARGIAHQDERIRMERVAAQIFAAA